MAPPIPPPRNLLVFHLAAIATMTAATSKRGTIGTLHDPPPFRRGFHSHFTYSNIWAKRGNVVQSFLYTTATTGSIVNVGLLFCKIRYYKYNCPAAAGSIFFPYPLLFHALAMYKYM